MVAELVRRIDAFNSAVGRAVSWLNVFMVVVTFLVVVLRYVFGVGWVWMQQSILYAHAALFLCAAAYAWMRDAQVRVDVIYRGASERRKAWVNLLGTLFLLFPVCVMIFYQAWPYVADSWAVWEGSGEAGGIPAVFALKTLILVFSALLFLQGVAEAGRSVLVLRGEASRG